MKILGIYKAALSALADGEQTQAQVDKSGRLVMSSGTDVPVASGGQITSLTSAVGLSTLATIPSTATRVLLQAEDQDIRWRDDGTDPTTSVGMKLEARQTIEYAGDLSAIRFIAVVAGAKLNVLYYR